MQVKGLIRADVEINEIDVIEEMLLKIGRVKKYNPYFLFIKEGRLVERYDESYHGSPTWNYSIKTEDPVDVELFSHLAEVHKILKNR